MSGNFELVISLRHQEDSDWGRISAKDEGTGKETKYQIYASGGLK